MIQVPSALQLPDLREKGRAHLSLELQLRMEANDLAVMQDMARNNQRCTVLQRVSLMVMVIVIVLVD